MKLAAYGYLVGSFMLTGGSLAEVGGIAQGGAMAVLGITVWYLLAKAWPEYCKAQRLDRKAFLDALKEDREALLEAQKEAREGAEESIRQLSEAFNNMIARCSK